MMTSQNPKGFSEWKLPVEGPHSERTKEKCVTSVQAQHPRRSLHVPAILGSFSILAFTVCGEVGGGWSKEFDGA